MTDQHLSENPDIQADRPRVKVYFNPFAFTMEQNNEFIVAGYEVMPLRIPNARRH